MTNRHRAGLPLPNNQVIDTAAMSRELAVTPNNRLQTLVQHYGIKVEGDAHRALPDTDAVRQVYLIMAQNVKAKPQPWEPRYNFENISKESLNSLPEKVKTAQSMHFGYHDQEGNHTLRTVTPYGWAETKKGLIMHGLCHLRGSRRTFSVERVEVEG